MDLITSLWFDGRAREAANFYTSIFPDSEIADNFTKDERLVGRARSRKLSTHDTSDA